jgi:hypothetical protein
MATKITLPDPVQPRHRASAYSKNAHTDLQPRIGGLAKSNRLIHISNEKVCVEALFIGQAQRELNREKQLNERRGKR